MTAELLGLRLRNQHLACRRLDDPAELVSHLGAVQAQDYPAAKWAIALRLRTASDLVLETAYAEGRILRTHVLRPTWHFVAPDDIRWMLKLTGARIKQAMGFYTRSIGMDEALFGRASTVIQRALEGGQSLTRADIGAALQQADVSVPDPGALGQLMLRAEVDGLVVSGPPRGRQHTYALLEERVAPAPVLEGDAALAELTWRYFNSHGPALVQDCNWWSGLTVSEVRRGLELNRERLDCLTVDGQTYYWGRGASAADASGVVHLLPNFDEYTVAYRARELFYDPTLSKTGNPREDVPFRDVIVAGGRVAGRWQRTPRRSASATERSWWIEPTEPMQRELESAVTRYAEFVGSVGV